MTDTSTAPNQMPKAWEAPPEDEATAIMQEDAAERAAWLAEQEAEWLDAGGEV